MQSAPANCKINLTDGAMNIFLCSPCLARGVNERIIVGSALIGQSLGYISAGCIFAMSRLLLFSSQIVLLLFSATASSEVKESTCKNTNGCNVCSLNGVLFKLDGQKRWFNIEPKSNLEIQEEPFKNVSVIHLPLKRKRISVLKRGSFRGLLILEHLFSDFNTVHFNKVQLRVHLFEELVQIMTWLTLSFNKIELIRAIPRDMIAGLHHLEWINLSHNNMTAVEMEFFLKVTPIPQILSLDHNKISRIAPGSFASFSTELEVLYLQYNQLEGLPSNAFRGLNKLEILFLNNNRITSISRAIFRDLVSLKLLYLHQNAISALESETFQDLSQLKSLILHGNKLTHIEVGTFAGLCNLEVLHLYNNSIRAVDNGTFADLVNLRVLLFYDNVTEHLCFT